jgi:hypothetical protein
LCTWGIQKLAVFGKTTTLLKQNSALQYCQVEFVRNLFNFVKSSLKLFTGIIFFTQHRLLCPNFFNSPHRPALLSFFLLIRLLPFTETARLEPHIISKYPTVPCFGRSTRMITSETKKMTMMCYRLGGSLGKSILW